MRLNYESEMRVNAVEWEASVKRQESRPLELRANIFTVTEHVRLGRPILIWELELLRKFVASNRCRVGAVARFLGVSRAQLRAWSANQPTGILGR